ncbi:hypothetical protein [Enterovibrio norvegicus]|uniref:hypothetical protein n=1 Tax=Enterovibrio norvegicus TaxID=188144 RepID=UPI00352E2BED
METLVKHFKARLAAWNYTFNYRSLLPYVILFIAFSLSTELATETHALNVQLWLKSIGPYVIVSAWFIGCGFWFMRRGSIDLGIVFPLLSSAAASIFMYVLLLDLIGELGDYASIYWSENPETVTAIIVTVVLLSFIFRCATMPFYSLDNSCVSKTVAPISAAMVSGESIKEMSPRDCHYAAAHETGHALMYAALGRLPEHFDVAIEKHTNNGTLGHVSGFDLGHQLEEKTMVEWQMMLLLAGQCGESFACDSMTTGSISDHKRWHTLATQYLSNNFEGNYFSPAPAGILELQNNESKIAALKQHQCCVIMEFFEENRDTFFAMSEALNETLLLTRNDVIHFLYNVNLTNGIPQPFGAFDVFSDKVLLSTV